MFEKLLQLYSKLDSFGVVAPPAHTTITPKVLILLDLHGNFLGAMLSRDTLIVPCTEESEYRTSGVAPHLIHDNLSYVGNIPGYEKRYNAYISQLEDYLGHVDDPLAQTVYAHVKKDLLLQEIKPITDSLPFPLQNISVAFGTRDSVTTINRTWTRYYTESLPINGICSITGEPAYIPKAYPGNLRKQGDMGKLFRSTENKRETGHAPIIAPGYITAQKICHAIQWLSAAPDVTVGDENGPLDNYIPLKDYAKMHNIDPANVRQKILRGSLQAKKIGNVWVIKRDTPYTDERKAKLPKRKISSKHYNNPTRQGNYKKGERK